MTPSWYDVLGVARDADSADIRTAWKTQVADLDPTDRRFRLLNRAAEVLLDEDRRSAHDLELATQEAVEHEDDGEDEAAVEAAWVPEASGTAGVGDGVPTTHEIAPRRGPGLVTTSVLGVVALLLLVAAVISLVTGGAGDAVDSGDQLPDAREVAAARAAAEAAVVPVLSYDFRELEQDKQAALSYMTPKYAAEYEKLFESVIAVNAPSTQTVVSVDVLASGIVRTGPDLVDVLLFVNRPTTNKQTTTPEVYKDQATLRMREIGGDWLVDCVISGAGSTCEA